jgi:predicted peptidase
MKIACGTSFMTLPAMLCAVCALWLALISSGCAARSAPLKQATADGAFAMSERGILFREVTVQAKGNQVSRRYAVYVPRDLNLDQPAPCIVMLNGRGECGTDGQKHLAVGLIPAVLFDDKGWPFIIVCVQKPDFDSLWLDHDDLILAALDATRKEWSIDDSRIYLTGLSQGGAGTWAIGAKHADRFAAIAPVCGFGPATEEVANALKSMPIWAFHGGKDDVVPVSATEKLAAAVKAAGGDPKVTIFPDLQHNSWDAAYRTQKLGEWFLQHKKAR